MPRYHSDFIGINIRLIDLYRRKVGGELNLRDHREQESVQI